MLRRSALFIPGNNPAMLLSSNILGADTIIFDLEDSVALNQKDDARILVKEAINKFDFNDIEIMVRINPLHSGFCFEDLDTILMTKVNTVLIPKATSDDVKVIDDYVNVFEKKHGLKNKVGFAILAETAYGVEMVVDTVKASKRINAIMLGGEDYSTDMGVKRTKQGVEIEYARNKIAIVAKAFNLHSFDTPFIDVDDISGLETDTIKAKTLGFTGKLLINPRQIETIHRIFAPTIDEIEEALTILKLMDEAKLQGKGVFAYNGKMVDLPIILKAEKLVLQARKLRLIP